MVVAEVKTMMTRTRMCQIMMMTRRMAKVSNVLKRIQSVGHNC